jgi:hypothetical protein
MASFRQAYLENVPGILADGEGAELGYCFGFTHDELAEWARHGVTCRFPLYGTDDALQAIGRDRQIVRGFAEGAEDYEQRLIGWLDSHLLGGNMFEMMDRLAKYLTGFAVRIRVVNNAGNWYTRDTDGSRSWLLRKHNWNWDGLTSAWSRFWVIIYPLSTGIWTDEGVWGDDSDHWGDPEGVWGLSATPEQVSTMREIVRHGKPPWSRCEFIIVSFDDTAFNPASPEPDGLWGSWGKYVGGVKREARLDTVRYIQGTVRTAIETADT